MSNNTGNTGVIGGSLELSKENIEIGEE